MRLARKQRVPIPLVGGQSDDPLDLGAGDTLNLYPVQTDLGVALRSVPGETVLSSYSGAGRGIWVSTQGDVYWMVTNTLYKNGVAQTGSVSGSGRIVWTDNANSQVGIVSNNTLYVLASGTVTAVADADLISGIHSAAFVDQYTLVANDTTVQFSTLNDMTAWAAADIFTAEGSPDPIVAMRALNRRLYFFGKYSTERYYNDGSTPFSRDAAGHIERGCLFGDSVVLLDNQFWWVADNGMVYAGNDPTNIRRVSNEAVDRDLAGAASVSGWGYEDQGHAFVGMTTPTGTWVFDVVTGQWTRRETYGVANLLTVGAVRHQGVVKAQKTGGSIVQYGTGNQASEGTLRRCRVLPTLRFQGRRFRVHCLELICETGGATSVEMELEVSGDRGRTWSDPYPASVGDVGSYGKRVRWHSIRSDRDLTFRLTQTDNAPATWVEAYADVEVFAH